MIPQILPDKASIETSTICNHTCQYCPVSEFPVAHQLMDLPLFRHVMDELAGLGRNLKRISFNHYNEPLVDPHLVERVRLALGYDFFRKILLNTNLSILPKTLPDELQQVKCADCAKCTISCPNGVQVASRVSRAQELFA